MNLQISYATLIAGLSLLAACGCGGGGGTSTTPTPISEQTIGDLTIVTKGVAPAVASVSGGGNTVTALTGADFSSVRLAASKDLATTRIAYWHNGTISICAPDGSRRDAIPMPIMVNDNSRIAFSPDGTRMAFSAAGASTGNTAVPDQIYEVNLDGTNFKRISNGLAVTANPSWSSTNKIVYNQLDSGSTSHIYIMNGDGTSPLRLTSGTVFDVQPSITFDGSRIVFSRISGSQPGLMVMDSNGKNIHPVRTSSGLSFSGPVWSPNGQQIAYMYTGSSASTVEIVSADGLSYGTAIKGPRSLTPVFSPDGKYIAYAEADGPDYVSHLRIYDPSAEDPRDFGLVGTNPGWSPFPLPRTLVGNSGVLGSGAGAVLISQDAKEVRSVVAIDSVTRTSLVAQNMGGSSPVVFKITGGGGIKTVFYVNDVRTSRLSLTAGSTNFTGVLVSFNADTGFVTTLVPYSKMFTVRPRVFEGEFLGLYDGAGHKKTGGGTHLQFDAKGRAVLTP